MSSTERASSQPGEQVIDLAGHLHLAAGQLAGLLFQRDAELR
jgi:hypothetical protein